MKRIFNHPPAPATGRKYWRSLEEFADTPEFRARLERELLAIPGIIGTGLFVAMASLVLVASADGKPPRILKPKS